MAVTLEDLEKRLSAVEQELASLSLAISALGAEAALKRGKRMLRDADRGQAELSAGWAKAMQAMGIPLLEPIGAEKLQAMMLAEGIDPQDNACSRGIVEMREE